MTRNLGPYSEICTFPKLMSYSHLKCHPNVINDKKVGKTHLVDLRAMQAVEDPLGRPEAPGLVAYSDALLGEDRHGVLMSGGTQAAYGYRYLHRRSSGDRHMTHELGTWKKK
jgi:hypothetical protein